MSLFGSPQQQQGPVPFIHCPNFVEPIPGTLIDVTKILKIVFDTETSVFKDDSSPSGTGELQRFCCYVYLAGDMRPHPTMIFPCKDQQTGLAMLGLSRPSNLTRV